MPVNVPREEPTSARLTRVVGQTKEDVERRFARAVASRTDEWLERFPGPGFRRTLPFSLKHKYDGAKAVTLDGRPLHSVIWLTITSSIGAPDYHLDVQIKGRRCRIRHRIPDRYDATMRVTLANMIRMAAGAAESSIVMSQGGIGVTGDAFLLARFPGLFGLPSRPTLPIAPTEGGTQT